MNLSGDTLTIEQGDEELELELSHTPHDEDLVKYLHLPDGRHVVAYISHHDDCESPFQEGHANGEFVDRRHCGQQNELRVRAAMGLDEYGGQDDSIIPDPYAVLCDVYSHSGDIWRIHNSGRQFTDEQWDVSNGAGMWLADDDAIENIEGRLLDELLPGYSLTRDEERKGPKLKLFHYQSIEGSDQKKRRRVGRFYATYLGVLRAASRDAGMPMISTEGYASLRRKYSLAYAEPLIEEYNEWCAGETFGVAIDVFDIAGERFDAECEANWGYIGRKYAAEGRDELLAEHITQGAPV